MLQQQVDYTVSASALRAALEKAWEPAPRRPYSEIASEHLILSPEYSKSAAPVDFDLYPFLREPLDRLGPDDPCRVAVLKACVQGGKTLLEQAFLTGIILQNPGPVLWVTATDTLAENFSKKRLDMMVRDSPALRARVAEDKGRSKDNTLKLKRFPGGDVKIVGAQSATGLISDTCRYVIIDEADEHRENLSRSGSSIDLALARTTVYGDLSKAVIVSSPKVKGLSEIDSWHDKGDQRVFRVPCVRCGEMQALKFRVPTADGTSFEPRLVWDPGDPSSAHYVCEYCGGDWSESEKSIFMPAGRWHATRPDIGGGVITSYSYNSLILPAGGYSWADLARQWESAMARLKAGDHDEHRTVINTRLGESYEVPGDVIDAHSLQRLVEPAWDEDAIPAGVKVITVGTDVQRHTRLETIVLGWGAGWECWVLDYEVILGDPSSREAWDRHDEIVRRVYTTADGRRLRPAAACVDRGDMASKVMEYTGPRYKWGVHAVKGDDGGPRDAVWDKTLRWSDRNKARKSAYYTVRTTPAKDEIQRMLKVTAPGPLYVHVPDRILKDHPDFFAQLTAERRSSVRDAKGKVQVAWKKITEHHRNEVLDTFVYALAGAHSLAMGGSKFHLSQKAGPDPEPSTPVVPPPAPEPTPPSDPSRHPPAKRPDSGPRGVPRRPASPSGWLNGGRGRNPGGKWL